jgi:SAM-dependent methyltransferase
VELGRRLTVVQGDHASSGSARVSRTRPFYAEHADAYDLLVSDPVEPWVEAVHEHLVSLGWPSAAVLDAGCGTGRHAAALAAKGHRVDVADASARLLAQAASRNPAARALHLDLCTFTTDTAYQAVMCRGVLNDMTADAERDAVLRAFAGALAEGGLLLLDVREAEGARGRADGVPRRRTVDLGGGGVLHFTSTATWQAGLIVVVEESELQRPGTHPEYSGHCEHHTFEFAMRPWSARELAERLTAAGFGRISVQPGVGRSTGDRLFVTARRG